MKKTLCILLAAIAVVALFAGCETKDLDERTTGTTGPNLDLTPDKVGQVMNDLGITGTDLSPEEQALLQSELAKENYDVTFENGNLQVKPPEGITLAPVTEAPTEPPPLPKGEVVASNAEVVALLKAAQVIFDSKVFTMKFVGSSNVPIADLPFGAGGSESGTLIMDQNRVALESSNLGSAFANMGGEEDFYGQNRIRAALLEAYLGKTMRTVISKNAMLVIFPDTKRYLDFATFMSEVAAEAGEDIGDVNLNEMPGIDFDALSSSFTFGIADVDPKNVVQSKVKDGDKEYICATLEAEADGVAYTQNFYFLGKDLKRIERLVTNPANPAEPYRAVTTIESLSGTVDKKKFDTSGMKPVGLLEFAQKMGGGSLLTGG